MDAIDIEARNSMERISRAMELWLNNHRSASDWVIKATFTALCRQYGQEPSRELARELTLAETNKRRFLAASNYG